MIALLQRVARAQVTVGDRVTGAIDQGLLVFVCAEPEDTPLLAERMVAKLLKLRVFADAQGKMNLSLVDVRGGLLLVSQFTLAADLSHGNRPGFGAAAAPALGRSIYEHILRAARAAHDPVACGEFGADMQVSLVNDGPVTMSLVLR